MSINYGTHFLVELVGCDPERIKYVQNVRPILLNAAQNCGAKILANHFHQFEPFGVTGIILIAESHFALHTFPETGYVAFDILTCGEMDAMAAINEVRVNINAGKIKVRKFIRGLDEE